MLQHAYAIAYACVRIVATCVRNNCCNNAYAMSTHAYATVATVATVVATVATIVATVKPEHT